MTFGLRSKVTIIAAAVFVAAITAIVLTSGHYFGTVLTKAQISRAQSLSQGLALQMERILALGLSVRELRGFEQQCVETVRAHEGVAYAMIVAPDGAILFHSDREQMHTRLPPGPLLQAIAADAASTDDRRLGLKFALSPVRDPSTEVRAISVVAYPQTIINSARNEMMQITLGVGAVVAALGLMLLYAALSRYVNKPLDEVVQAIERLRSGETADAIPLPTAGSRELAIMVHGFNGMLDRVAARERELVAAKEAAETATRTKSGFLAMMSHELRTPMNAVLGMAELLNSTSLTERQTRYLRNIIAGSSALLRILDDILNFTRVEMGELTIQHAPFALPRLVEKSVALFQETAAEKGLEVAVHIDPAVPAVVIGDAGRTRQILVNLLGNALKFTDKGTVTVRVGPAGVDRVRFSVTDTGIGSIRRSGKVSIARSARKIPGMRGNTAALAWALRLSNGCATRWKEASIWNPRQAKVQRSASSCRCPRRLPKRGPMATRPPLPPRCRKVLRLRRRHNPARSACSWSKTIASTRTWSSVISKSPPTRSRWPPTASKVSKCFSASASTSC